MGCGDWAEEEHSLRRQGSVHRMRLQRFTPPGTSASGTHQTRRGGGVGRYGRRPDAFVGLCLFFSDLVGYSSRCLAGTWRHGRVHTDKQTLGLVFNGRPR